MRPWKFLTNAYVEAVCSRDRFPVLRLSGVAGWVGELATYPSREPQFDVGLRHDGETYIQEADKRAWRRVGVGSLAPI